MIGPAGAFDRADVAPPPGRRPLRRRSSSAAASPAPASRSTPPPAGLRTALVERDDFASGTSSKSSKLVHGGLRYLQQGEVRLVYEALAERQRLRQQRAPPGQGPARSCIPIFGKDGVITAEARPGPRHAPCGCTTSPAAPASASSTSASAPTRPSPTCRRCPRDRLAVGLPLLRRPGRRRPPHAHPRPHRGARPRRGRRQPAARSSAHQGRATARVTRRHGRGRRPTHSTSRPRPSSTPPACGPTTCAPSTRAPTPTRSARPRASTSRCRGRRCATTSPWSCPVPKDKRSVFVVPWGDFTYIGTTDTDYDGPIDDPQCTPDDIAYLLRGHQRRGDDRASPTADIARHLGRAAAAGEARRQRAHRRPVAHATGSTPSASGVVTVTGGKLTTYRRDGGRHRRRRCVEQVLGAEVARAASAKRSRTRKLPLRGAEGYDRGARGRIVDPGRRAAGGRAPRRPLRRRGPGAAGHDRGATPTLAEPLVAGPPLPAGRGASTRRATRWPARVDDVLRRRTRARLLARDASAAAAADGRRAHRRRPRAGTRPSRSARSRPTAPWSTTSAPRPTCPRPRSTRWGSPGPDRVASPA